MPLSSLSSRGFSRFFCSVIPIPNSRIGYQAAVSILDVFKFTVIHKLAELVFTDTANAAHLFHGFEHGEDIGGFFFMRQNNTPVSFSLVIAFQISATDGRGRVLTRVSLPRGSHRAVLIACDAINAHAVTGQEYHYHFHAAVSNKLPALAFRLSVLSLRHSNIMAYPPPLGMKTESVRFALYCGALSTAAFFFKEQ